MGSLSHGNNLTANNNLVYSNTTAGIWVNGSGDSVSGNVIYSNGWGVRLQSDSEHGWCRITCIYNNSTGGIDFIASQLTPRVVNNTIYQPSRRRPANRCVFRQPRQQFHRAGQHHLDAERI